VGYAGVAERHHGADAARATMGAMRGGIILVLMLALGGCKSTGGSTDGGGAQGGTADGGSRGGSAAGGSPGDGGTGGNGASGTRDGGNDAGNDGGSNPGLAPGSNFDLSLWELQEPVGSAGSPTTIAPAALVAGFHDNYFFTDPTDGAMTFWDPESGVTTADSNYPRSELREMNGDGSPANWPVSGTNTLSASVAVTQVPDHVCIGQIHLGTAILSGLAASTKPLLELYYYATGAIELGIEDDPTGGQTSHAITSVPLGTRFNYTIQLTGDGTITLAINGAATTFTMPSSFSGYGQYFKAGDYDQSAGTDATVGATVKFYSLAVSH
jgi:hypothetical protein